MLIQLEHIYKIYQMGSTEVRALDDVSLEIDKGEYVAIVGQSGSGKSTLMNVLGCLDIPTSGTYMLNGIDVSDLSDNRLAKIRSEEIGFIFQGFNLLYSLTAIENVELPLVYKGVWGGKRRKRAKEVLATVGLQDRLYHKPSELSGGQQQRVAVARALITDPPIILADEPTGNLDSQSGTELLQLMGELHRMGNTIVIITHDNGIAEKAARVVKIMDGRIVGDSRGSGGGFLFIQEQTGTPESIDITEATGTAESVEIPEATGTAELNETVEATGTAETSISPEPSGIAESTETVVPNDTVESTGTIESTGTAEQAAASESMPAEEETNKTAEAEGAVEKR